MFTIDIVVLSYILYILYNRSFVGCLWCFLTAKAAKVKETLTGMFRIKGTATIKNGKLMLDVSLTDIGESPHGAEKSNIASRKYQYRTKIPRFPKIVIL